MIAAVSGCVAPIFGVKSCQYQGASLVAIIRYLWTDEGGDAIESGVSFVDLPDEFNNKPDNIWGCWTEVLGNPPYVGPVERPYSKWLEISDFIPGVQPTLIDLNSIRQDFNSREFIKVRLVSDWYSVRNSGNFQIAITVVQGGVVTIPDPGNDFVVVGGKIVHGYLLNLNSKTVGIFCGPADDQGIITISLFTGEVFMPGQPIKPRGRVANGCMSPVFGVAITPQMACPAIFYNTEISGSCPDGFEARTYVVPAKKFSSLISQQDADNQAQSYLNELLTNCVPSAPPNFSISYVPASRQEGGSAVLTTHSVSPSTGFSLVNQSSFEQDFDLASGVIMGASILGVTSENFKGISTGSILITNTGSRSAHISVNYSCFASSAVLSPTSSQTSTGLSMVTTDHAVLTSTDAYAGTMPYQVLDPKLQPPTTTGPVLFSGDFVFDLPPGEHFAIGLSALCRILFISLSFPTSIQKTAESHTTMHLSIS